MATTDSFGGFNNTDFIVAGGRPGMGKLRVQALTVTETAGPKKTKSRRCSSVPRDASGTNL